MRDRIFLDSNILVYSSLEDNENKHHKVRTPEVPFLLKST